MPFSIMIPLSKLFINKPLNNRMNIVKTVWNARLVSHASVFTVGKGLPVIIALNSSEDIIDAIINIGL